MNDFLTEYAAYCEAHGRPDRVELMLCDINAVLRGKWLPGDDEQKLSEGGVRLPLSTYAPNILGEEVEATGLGIIVGDPDGRLYPVPGTLRPVPWAASGQQVAQVLVEMDDETGEVAQFSPRFQLEKVLDRFRARGLTPVVATELEFYLYKPRDARDDAPEPPERSPLAQNYDLEVLDRTQAILDDILDGAYAQGMAPDTLIAEYGPGQFEINFHHTDDALAAADDALFFRRLVRGTARRHGMSATFMAKPYADYPGNGMHAHISLIDEAGRNVFDDGGPGPSALLKQAVAGTLATMADLQAIFAPHMNSYRRFQPASFAPHAPDWGIDNRAAAVRLPEVPGSNTASRAPIQTPISCSRRSSAACCTGWKTPICRCPCRSTTKTAATPTRSPPTGRPRWRSSPPPRSPRRSSARNTAIFTPPCAATRSPSSPPRSARSSIAPTSGGCDPALGTPRLCRCAPDT